MGEGDKATLRVDVLDEPFRIATVADPEYTRRVAAHVDRTFRALRASGRSLEPFPAAVLGAMEITDALFKAREGIETGLEEAIRKVDELSARIDTALDADAGGKETK